MLEISISHAIPQVERQERKPEAFVLRDVAQLVTPDRGRRFEARDDHVAERDRTEAASCQDYVRKPAIAHVKKAAIPAAGKRERKQTQDVPDRIGVMRDEGPAEGQGMDATTSSTAARTRARLVSDESK